MDGGRKKKRKDKEYEKLRTKIICCTRPVESPHPWMVVVTGGSCYPSRGGKSTGRVKNPRVGRVKSLGKGNRELLRGMK